eukprot:6204678-Pleurochrysis_carterae.AAC.10
MIIAVRRAQQNHHRISKVAPSISSSHLEGSPITTACGRHVHSTAFTAQPTRRTQGSVAARRAAQWQPARPGTCLPGLSQ